MLRSGQHEVRVAVPYALIFSSTIRAALMSKLRLVVRPVLDIVALQSVLVSEVLRGVAGAWHGLVEGSEQAIGGATMLLRAPWRRHRFYLTVINCRAV